MNAGERLKQELARSEAPDMIADKAAEWAVMAEYGEMTPDHRSELDLWLAADDRHRGAYLRARAGLYLAEDAVLQASSLPAGPAVVSLAPGNDNGDGYDTGLGEPVQRRSLSWGGRALAGGFALAASLAGLLIFASPPASLLPPAVYAPADQVVVLKDGSVATLSDDSQIEVALTADHRRITLVKGEATFKVAHDKARPFVVRSGDVYAQATGTVYSVTKLGDAGSTIKVQEGSVLVWARDDRDQAVLLQAGGELTLKPGPQVVKTATNAPLPRHQPPPELAQFSFDNEPISAAVARFNRVNSTKIEIEDPEIGDVEIVGLFRANDPERFAHAAALLSGAEVIEKNDRIVIKLK